MPQYHFEKLCETKFTEWKRHYNSSNPKQQLVDITLVAIGDC